MRSINTYCVVAALLAGCAGSTPPPRAAQPRPAKPAADGVAPVVPMLGDAPLQRSPLSPARKDYVFPVPRGFSPGEKVGGTLGASASRLAASGGIMLVTRHRGFGAGPLVGIIAVAPAVSGVGVTANEGGCKRVARTLGRRTGHTITFAGVVPAGGGRGCQIRGAAGKSSPRPHRRIIVTIVEQRGSAWLINCDLDDRDLVAIQGCKAVVAGWRFVR